MLTSMRRCAAPPVQPIVLLVAGVRGSASEIIALASGRAEHGQRPRQR